MAKVHELFKNFLNAIFDVKLLSLSAIVYTIIILINSEIFLVSHCLDMRFWLGSKLFFSTEFVLTLTTFGSIVIALLILLSACYTFRFESSILANYHLRFPKIEKETICLLVLWNIFVIPLACGNLQTLDRLMVISSHVCDSVGLYELAERAGSIAYTGRSILVDKWDCSSRESGQLDPDSKFERIISSVHGSNSANLAERHLQLYRYYRSKNNFSKAIDEALKALAIFEHNSTFGEVNSLLSMAVIYKRTGETQKAKELLSRSMKILDYSPAYLDISMEKLAKALNDQTNLKKLEELNNVQQKAEHPQILHPKHTFKVHTTSMLSFLAAFGLFQIFTLIGWAPFSIHAIPGIERKLKSASFEESLELLQDLIAIELFYKNYEAVDRHSRRFLELCQEAA